MYNCFLSYYYKVVSLQQFAILFLVRDFFFSNLRWGILFTALCCLDSKEIMEGSWSSNLFNGCVDGK